MSSVAYHPSRHYDLAAARRAIFAECRNQGIDEGARHLLLREVGGIASGSMKDMNAAAAQRVLAHLRRRGGNVSHRRNEWAFIDAALETKRPLLRKICVLCKKLGVGKAYAEGVARRQHGIERHLEMMDHGELWMAVGALQRTLDTKRAAAPGRRPAAE